MKEEVESVAECLRQIVADRWASIRKRSFTKCFCVYTGGDKGSCGQMQIVIVLLEYKVEVDRTDTEGLFQRWN